MDNDRLHRRERVGGEVEEGREIFPAAVGPSRLDHNQSRPMDFLFLFFSLSDPNRSQERGVKGRTVEFWRSEN